MIDDSLFRATDPRDVLFWTKVCERFDGYVKQVWGLTVYTSLDEEGRPNTVFPPGSSEEEMEVVYSVGLAFLNGAAVGDVVGAAATSFIADRTREWYSRMGASHRMN